MNKFKVGDKVKRIDLNFKYTSPEHAEYFRKGLPLTVSGVVCDTSITFKEIRMEWNTERFELVEDASKHHTHHDLIIAWAKGAEIEIETSIKGRWKSLNHPDWNINYVYRIKPEPSPEKEELKNIIADMKEQLANATKRLEELS